jgi:Toprim domain
MKIRAIARALGGDIVSSRQLLCPGPGHGPKDRSLSVLLANNDDGFVCHSHAGDDWQTCKDYVRERLGWPSWQPGDGRDRCVNPSQLAAFDRAAINTEAERRERTPDDLTRIERARAIWNTAADPGTLAKWYLASRALVLTDDIASTVLRFHPACPWRDENTGRTVDVPALIAAFRSLDDDSITAIHRIRLDQPERWPKAERRMLGIVHRAAVKLDAAGSTLAVGEGVETCLAARQLGQKPAWALGSVGMIAKFPVIEGVERLRILGEAGEASALAIQHCGRRWHRAGRKVQIVTPDVGSDLNDELMAVTA